MNLPAAIRTARWMVRDTFRQAVATRLAWVMLAVTAACTGVCLSVGVSGDEVPAGDRDFKGVVTPRRATEIGHDAAQRSGAATLSDADAEALGRQIAAADGVRVAGGELSLGFGAVTVPLGRGRVDAVRQLQLLLAGVVGDALGVLLALLWTAGFLPAFLDPQSATVLLAKPAPRWSLLLGKYVGVCLFVGLNAALFVGATWAALGVKTGVWGAAYWLAVPLLVANFAVFYSVSAFLAVWTRNTVAAAFGTLLFWAVCWATNYTHHYLLAFPPFETAGGPSAALEAAYWLLPKPFDLGAIFYDALDAGNYAEKPPAIVVLQETGRFHAGASVAASGLFAAATLAAAAYEFEVTDY